MKEIILKMDSPKEAVDMISLLCKNGFKPYKATLSYNIREKLPVKIKKLADYPLILEGIFNGHEMRVAVTPLAIGSFCDGSYALRRILKMTDFYMDDLEIFTLKRFNPNTGYLHLTLLQK